MARTPVASTRRDDQSKAMEEVVALLSRPESYPEATQNVECVETHISWVFLTDRFVYKMKKPVRFDFLDYSTSRRRLLHCRREVRLGRRLAPDVYLDVVPITTDRDGELRLDGKGRALAHAVKMRRLPDELMLDTLIRARAVPAPRVGRLIALLVKFYRTAARGRSTSRWARPTVILRNVKGNFTVLTQHAELFGPTALGKIQAAQLQLLELCPEVFEQRIREGRICEGHGDLRAEHICMLAQPVVFDPVEFSKPLRSVDAIDELSFLAMECDFLGDERLGETLLRGYQRGAGDSAPQEIVGFYKSYRACVRAKVEALREEQLEGGVSTVTRARDRNARRACEGRARRYLALAANYCDGFYRPKLLITMGLMGTGKSTLATGVADRLGMTVLRSDLVRQELAGRRDRAARYGTGMYSAEFTGRVYRELVSRAEKLLRRGVSVVLDATFLRRRYRDLARSAARRAGAQALAVHCICPASVVLGRLARRSKELAALSDARPELYEQQRGDFEPPASDEPTVCVRTRGEAKDVCRRAMREMRRRGWS